LPYSVVNSLHRQLPLILLDPSHQILYCAHLNTPLLPKLEAVLRPHHSRARQLRPPIHTLPVADHLADNTHGLLPRESAQIDRSLRMPSPDPHTPISRLQRQDMSRPPELARLRIGVRKHAARQAAVVGRDARGDGVSVRVDADGVRGAVWIRVVGDHLREVQGCGAADGERGADVAAAVADHEGCFFGREALGGDDQVAFVFAVGGVKDDYEFAVGCGG
jgi:hypothetical protein